MTFSDPFAYITDFSEKNLIEKLGLDYNNIKEFRRRDLTESVDYRYAKYNQITYTREGFEKLLKYCGLRNEIDDSLLEALVTAFPANKNMLIARLDDGREVRVRIKSRHNILKGMKITIQRDPGGLFELRSPYPNPSKFLTVIQGAT